MGLRKKQYLNTPNWGFPIPINNSPTLWTPNDVQKFNLSLPLSNYTDLYMPISDTSFKSRTTVD